MEKNFKELLATIKNYNEKADIKKVKQAWEFTKLAHLGQKRFSGEPYASHGLATALVLANWKLDIASIIAGLLHDTIEDGGAKRRDIVNKFGEDVAILVDGVTKVSKVRLRASEEEEFVENLRKMFLAMAKDLRVVLVKLADRLHNMQTLSALPKQKQKRIAKETLEIYAPLAERLGMGRLKMQLEDLSFPFAYPDEFQKVKKESARHYKKAQERLTKMRRVILTSLLKEKVKAKVDGRKKGLYSLWGKLERPGIDWDYKKVHDIVALRIMVNSVKECYLALGVVHDIYKPAPSLGISDFIAQPKPNGYRSIHTKVFGSGNKIAEVQIRTYEMHEQAEYGMAAHWVYSKVKTSGKTSDDVLEKKGAFVSDKKLSWVRQLANWQKEISDSKEFLEAVKFDALKHRNFVFSPKGDVYDLPTEATPVDFAYAVHTGLGKYIKAAKVNGKIVPLNHKLKSGDICEIIKTKNPKKPSRDWLNFVVTTAAKRKMNRLGG